MSRANRIFLIVGRIIFVILIIYLIVMPLILPFVVSTGGGEFGGLWLLVLFPHLILLGSNGLQEVISISNKIVLLIASASFVAFFVLKFSMRRRYDFNIGYSWLIMGTIVLTILLTFSVDRYFYPFRSDDSLNWSIAAVEQNDPNICLQKVIPYNQEQCLTKAAIKSGNLEYCEAILRTEENAAISGQAKMNDILTRNCKTQVAIIGNISKQFCKKDYDSDCVENEACETDPYKGKTPHIYSCSSAVLNGYLDSYIEDMRSLAACELFKGAPDDQERIKKCRSYSQATN